MNPKLAVEIESNTVTLTIICKDDYAAIALYEELCLSARKGCVKLCVLTDASTAEWRDIDGV